MTKERVNGRLLAQFVGEQVIILGIVKNISSNGKSLELMTTDGMQVNVALPGPIDGHVEGYIEVHGTLHSKSTMNCSSYLVYPPDASEGFSAEQYDEVLGILNVLGPERWKMNDDESEFL